MKHYLFIILTCLLCVLTHAQKGYWQQQVNYTIDVKLNDSVHTLDGFAKIEYINNSPDTLHFIWFHIWPNAYKNDKTAFSDQLLENGRKDFYFSDNSQRGYINQLDFRAGGETAVMEDHPQHIDVVKVILPQPLAPGKKVEITTPFHVQLPFIFSRSGHIGKSYQVTQWYPKPAVYDTKGWHPMPYLDQGEFYSEFGAYDVRITIPKDYALASTGELQSEERTGNQVERRYKQNNVHDFAWFADKEFIVKQDTLQLPSGRIIKLFNYYTSKEAKLWENAIQYMKDALTFRSMVLGEYPYNVASIVQGPGVGAGGMEYPTITVLSGITTAKELDFIIEHELGHNWFYGILATNERAHPWMDEGMNSYYDLRYLQWKYGSTNVGLLEGLTGGKGIKNKFPGDEVAFAIDLVSSVKKDQPVSTRSEDFTLYNYNALAYMATARHMQDMASTNPAAFDSAMKVYYEKWKFKHPYPDDFWSTLTQATGNAYPQQQSINETGVWPAFEKKRQPKVTGFFNMKDYKKYHYIALLPAIGFNRYDKFMIGLGIHNYSLPLNKFRFALFPLYATNSKQFNGIGKLSYTWYPDKKVYSVQAGINGGKFSSLSGVDSLGQKVFGGFYKAVPFVKLVFNNNNERSKQTWWLDLRSYQIGEKGLDFVMKKSDSVFYPQEGSYETRYLNQVTLGVDNFRTLYPYEGQLQLQQAKDFYRLNFTGNYFFNYSKGGGFNMRLFAAKFGYIGSRSTSQELNTQPFQPKLTAVRGDEDFTYSNYFIGRNENEGFASQQIMMRDGGLKLRTDLFQGLQGRSDNWVASMNFTSTLPEKMFPIKLPIKLFLDVGTYAEAWERNAGTSRFLYVGGLQLSLLNNLINVYAPVIFSKEFKDNLKTIPEDYKFFKRLSFSIDLHNLNSRKMLAQTGVF
jgi:hypothetical protein